LWETGLGGEGAGNKACEEIRRDAGKGIGDGRGNGRVTEEKEWVRW